MRTSVRPQLSFESEINRDSLSYPPMMEKVRAAMDSDEKNVYGFIQRYNVRSMSPRQMFDLAGHLHQLGLISDIEYLQMSFQPELHPEYNSTVGRHVGKKAQPDAPRDFVEEWERRVHHDQRIGSLNMKKSWRILKILKHLELLSLRTGA